jgi:hypothetical protein
VRSPINSVRSQIAHTFEVLTRVTLTRARVPDLLAPVGPLYAGTASFSFLAASISFWAMCGGTSS